MDCGKKAEMLRALIGDDGRKEDSDVLSVYLEMAKAKILERLYPFKDSWDDVEVPDKYVMLQLKIATYMLNKRGAEGQIQHIENGVHRNYGDADVPESMLSDLVPFAQAIR
jgi:hypothetical protein